MAEETCPSCGARNPAGTEFCQACGTYLRWDATSTDLPAAAPAAPPVSPTQPAPAQGAGQQPSAPAPPPPAGPPPVQPTTVQSPAQPPPGPSQQPPAPVPQGNPACPRCGTQNPPELRFCAKCGLQLQQIERAGLTGAGATPPTRTTWWQRLTGRSSGGPSRTSVRQYRHSLSMRSRSLRIVVMVLVALGLGGALVVLRRSPMALGKQLVDTLRNTAKKVPTTAESVTVPGGKAQPAPTVVDGDAATAWTTTWLLKAGAAQPTCSAVGRPTPSVLVLKPNGTRDVRVLHYFVSVQDEAARSRQMTPSALLLIFDDGSCQRVEVKADGKDHNVSLKDPVSTSQVTVVIGSAAGPETQGNGPKNRISISELELRGRPPR